MSLPTGFNPSTTVSFVVKNNSSIQRSIKVFNNRISFGATLDLMKIPGVTEEDIKAELTKGSLKALLAGGSLQVVSSSVNFATVDSSQGGFLRSLGLSGNSDNTQALAQSIWYIDPTNGVDTNTGLTALTALKTHAELERRWGVGYPVLPGATSTVIATIKLITVNILGNLPSTDPINIQVTLPPNTLLAYVGTVTTVRTGILSAVTTKVRGTNTPWAVSDGVAFTTTDIGKMVRITSGANSGQRAWVAKDLGSNSVRMSSFSTPTMPGTSDVLIQTTLTTGSAAISDPYVLETMNQVYIRQIDIRSPLAGTGTTSTIGFVNFDFQNNGGALQQIPFIGGAVQGVFKCCKFSGGLVSSAVQRPHYLNCCAVNTITAVNMLTTFVWRSGLSIGPFVCRNSGIGFADDDAMIQTGGFVCQVSGVQLGTVCAFDSANEGFKFSSTGGMGVQAVCMNVAGGSGSHLLWGSGNTGVGVFCLAGSQLNYESAIPTVTGTAGDFKLGAGTTAFYFDAVTGAYVPGIAAATGGWTALAAAQPTGYGGNAHQPDRNAHICVRG